MKEAGGVLMFMGFFFMLNEGEWYPTLNLTGLALFVLGYVLFQKGGEDGSKNFR